MTFSENWRLRDEFTLVEAAALWCGIDPSRVNSRFPHLLPPEMVPVLKFIEDAHKTRVRPLINNLGLSTGELLKMRHIKSHVSRQWLEELALSKNVRPAFLFDTVRPDQVPEMAVKTVQIMTGAPGRPSSMHLIEAEFDRRISINQFEKTLAEEARHLRNWFSNNYADCPLPTEKTICNRLRTKYNAVCPK